MQARPSKLQQLVVLTGVIILALGMWYGAPEIHTTFSDLLSADYPFYSENDSSESVSISANRLAELKAEAALYQRLSQREQTLSTQIATGTLPAEYGLASITARPPQSPYDRLVINIGREAGVETGAVVWWPPGVYLGQVVNVRDSSSVVQLISSNGVTHPVLIADNVAAVTNGRGGGDLSAEVAEAAEVSAGALVISDQYELPIGEVVHTEVMENTGTKMLYIRRLAPISTLEVVYVGNP